MIVDTLLHARWIIPVEPRNVTYEHYSLAMHDGKIVELLPTSEACQKYQATVTEYLNQHALLPGFINCHTHAAMSLMRGIADDLPLMEWLQNHIWPLEQRWMSEAFVRDGTDLAIAEMLLGGTTCFNDMYFFPEVAAKQVLQAGIRAHLGNVVIDFPTVYAKDSDAYIAQGLAVQAMFANQPLLSFGFAPHAPYTVSDKPLESIHRWSEQLGMQVNMHVHETAQEVEAAVKTGQRPLQRLHKIGLLNQRFLAVHMTQLTAEDIALVADNKVSIVHCPESNLKLASGFCPVARCLAVGINVALGTDGAASNNDLDMLGEMRTAALLAKAVAQDASAVPAMTALEMATINGAKALGISSYTGSLGVGKAADVVAINLDDISTQPLYDPVSQIVYAANRQQVTDVWVAGKQLLKQRQFTKIDIDELKTRVASWQNRFAQP
jgi:5-methylthioadenosine/S-adenosylhomocysteine deaminase